MVLGNGEELTGCSGTEASFRFTEAHGETRGV